MEQIITRKVWKNNGNKQLIVTIPSKSNIQEGDLVVISKEPAMTRGEFDNLMKLLLGISIKVGMTPEELEKTLRG